MTEPTPPTPPTPPAPPAPPAAWHNGVEQETLGFWQNKGYKLDDPKALATDLTKQYRELERHLGVPPDQIIKMPKANASPEDIKAFRMRLGMPAEPKEYDFAAVKNAAGEPIPDALADALRTAAHNAGLAKDAAAAVAAAVVKHIDDAATAAKSAADLKLTEEKAGLKKNWGTNYDFNLLKAMEGARRLGISPDAVKALESQVGYAAVMETMRKIGASTAEDTFVERGGPGGTNPTTQAGAVARKSELMADDAWTKRFLAGGVTERREMDQLERLITGVSEAA